MSRTVHLNGRWLPEDEAKISIFDRGFLFADAIYEVTAVIDGKLIDYHGHMARFARSQAEMKFSLGLSETALLGLHREIVERNDLREGLIYLQLSRGAADRDFLFGSDIQPTFAMFTQAKPLLDNPKAETGLSVIAVPDLRWARRDIKTVQLLYSSLAKTAAKAKGADDVLLVENGIVTEASSANVHLVTSEGRLVTRDLSSAILPGITRRSVLDLAQAAGIPAEERSFTFEEARAATELFITSATSFVLPVVRLDGEAVGPGVPGPVTRRLRALYIQDRIAAAL